MSKSSDIDKGFTDLIDTIENLDRDTESFPDEMTKAIRTSFAQMNLHGWISFLDDKSRRITFKDLFISNPMRKLLTMIEGLSGVHIEGYSPDIRKSKSCKQVIEQKKSVFNADSSVVLREILPQKVRPYFQIIHKDFGKGPAVFSPIIVNREVEGILCVSGKLLLKEHSESVNALSNMLSTSLSEGVDRDRLSFIADERAISGKKVRELNGQYVALVESSVDAIVIADESGEIILANKAAERMFGYSSNEIIGQPITILIPDRYVKKHSNAFHNYISSGKKKVIGSVVKLEAINKYGVEIPIELSISTWKQKGEHYFAAILRDTSEVDFLEEALRQSDERFKLAFDHAVIGKGIAGPDGDLILVNDAFADMLGYSKEELQQKTWMDITHPEDLEQSGEFVQQLMAGEIPSFNFEHRLTKANGSLVWVRLSLVLLRDSRGLPLYMVGDIEDVSDRVLAEVQAKRKATELGTLNTLGDKLRTGLTTSEISDAALEVVGKLSHVDLALIFLRDGNDLRLQGSTVSDSKFRHKETPVHRVGECLCGLSVKTKEAIYVTDIHHDPRCTWQECKQAGLKSFASLPFVINGEVLGVLGIGSGEEHDFSLRKEFLGTIASSMSLALKKSILHQQTIDELAERKRVQKSLAESEVRFRDLYENAPNAYFSVGTDGKIVRSNQKAADLVGIPIDKLVGTHILKLYGDTSQGKASAKKVLAKLLAGETVENEELQMQHADGTLVWISLTVNAILDDDGKVMFSRSMVVDISERKRAEESLLLQTTALEAASNGIVIADRDGDIVWVNSSFTFLTGYSAKEVIGQNPRILKSGEQDISIYKHLWDTILAGDVWRGTLINKRKDGTLYTEEQTVTPVIDESGEISHFIAIKQDISERVQAEKELLESERILRESQNVARLGNYTLDIATGNWKSSELLDGIFGIDMDFDRSIEGWISIVHPEERQMMADYFAQEVLEKRGRFDKEYRVIRRNDISERWVHGLGELEMDADENPIKMNGTIHDITARKQTEQLLSALNRASLSTDLSKSFEDTFNSIAKELRPIGFSCMFFPLDESGTKLLTKYVSFDSKLIKSMEKMTGIELSKFAINLKDMDHYRVVVRDRMAVFVTNTESIILKVLPKKARKFAPQIAKMLDLRVSIPAPLIVNDKVIGVFSLSSNNLTERDIPTVIAFADQMAASYERARLMNELEASLAEVIQARMEVQENLEIIKNTFEGTVNALATTAEKRDPYTAGHQDAVKEFAVAIAQELGLEEEQIEGLKVASVLHDIGKMYVPAEILNKPGVLTDTEMELIKTHPSVGYEILKSVNFPWPVADIVLQHHERIDGSGYPKGISGKEILIETRIITVADMVNAICSHRPYRPALGMKVAVKELKKNKGIFFDPKVVDVALKLMSKEDFSIN